MRGHSCKVSYSSCLTWSEGPYQKNKQKKTKKKKKRFVFLFVGYYRVLIFLIIVVFSIFETFIFHVAKCKRIQRSIKDLNRWVQFHSAFKSVRMSYFVPWNTYIIAQQISIVLNTDTKKIVFVSCFLVSTYR